MADDFISDILDFAVGLFKVGVKVAETAGELTEKGAAGAWSYATTPAPPPTTMDYVLGDSYAQNYTQTQWQNWGGQPTYGGMFANVVLGGPGYDGYGGYGGYGSAAPPSQQRPLAQQTSTSTQQRPLAQQTSTSAQQRPLASQTSTPVQPRPSVQQTSTPVQPRPSVQQTSTSAQPRPPVQQAANRAQQQPLAPVASKPRDIHQILDLPKETPSDQVARAYRKEAIKYHPDKNSSDDAITKFAELQTAYDKFKQKPLNQVSTLNQVSPLSLVSKEESSPNSPAPVQRNKSTKSLRDDAMPEDKRSQGKGNSGNDIDPGLIISLGAMSLCCGPIGVLVFAAAVLAMLAYASITKKDDVQSQSKSIDTEKAPPLQNMKAVANTTTLPQISSIKAPPPLAIAAPKSSPKLTEAPESSKDQQASKKAI